MANNTEYNAESIYSMSDMESIRRRPNGLLVDMGAAGVTQLIWEYVTNSLDEYIALQRSGTIDVAVMCDIASNVFQIIIRDDGRGIPQERLVNVYTKLNTSGKVYSNSAYRSSTGEFGKGAKVATALSTQFKAISKSYIENVVSMLHTENGVIVKTESDPAENTPSGVIVAFQLDMSFFTDLAGVNFGMANYNDVVNMCRRLSIFNEIATFRVFRSEHLLPASFWNNDIPKSIATITRAISASSCEFDSSKEIDKSEYLFSQWRMSHAPQFSDRVLKKPVNDEDKLEFDIRLYFTKKSPTSTPQYFLTVNNVAMMDYSTDSVTVTTVKVFRDILSEYIEDPNYKKFVKEEYTFPTMLAAIGILYNGALHGGTTKSSFRNKAFETQYYSELYNLLTAKGTEYWQKIYELLSNDVVMRYSSYYDIPAKKADEHVFTDLNLPDNYYDCRSTDNTKTELYIVEGTSAGSIVSTRNPDYQAIYTTRGKPLNPARREERIELDRRDLTKDKIYQDIMRILNVNSRTTDISNCRFSKIIIATDADPDGYHISTLHIHDLYLINPLLISSGLVWVANPPLYSIDISSNKRLFLRDKKALMDARINFMYIKAFDLQVVTEVGDKVNTVKVDRDLYREICYLITYIGEQFDVVAQQLNIPLLILERFVYAIRYLYPVIDYDRICEYFANSDNGNVQVNVLPEQQTLVISIGDEDYPISLADVGKAIRDYLLPLVKKYKYDNLYFNFRWLLKNASSHNYQLLSPMQLYTILVHINDEIKVKRYKGLGEMPKDSCFETLMDPATRSLTHIVEAGDASRNYRLVGRDTVEDRKALMASNGSLSSSFMRMNELLSSWNEVQ